MLFPEKISPSILSYPKAEISAVNMAIICLHTEIEVDIEGLLAKPFVGCRWIS
ncbi:hypothetical protein LCGC14_0979130 [marine sediment metagenome]|uniref:Uncharacterized protein n=1 Tax=marine sediment metagenome TaxID=412755 RepID=A0A0F9RFU0_9ZZZZ